MSHTHKNQIFTIIFLATFNFFALFLGYFIGGISGILVAYILAFTLNGTAYWYGDKIILWAIGAEPMDTLDNVRISRLVRELAKEAGIPPPGLYSMPAMEANSLSVGKSAAGSTLVISTGLMKLLNTNELKGMLAHEIVHIRNGDVLLNTVVAVITGVFAGIPESLDHLIKRTTKNKLAGTLGKGVSWTIRMIFCPIMVLLIQAPIFKEVDYRTDREAAVIAGGQEGLTSTLIKLAGQAPSSSGRSNPAFYHLYFINPVSGGALAFLFNTHPTIEKRLSKLREEQWVQPMTK